MLFTVTDILFAAFLSLTVLLWIDKDNPHRTASWLGSFIWSIHGLVFYSTILYARRFHGYAGPSLFFTIWSAALIFHAIFAIGGATIVRLRMFGRVHDG